MITNIFPTPIWNFKINIPEDLIDKINKLRESDPEGRIYSNVGGWQSNDIGNNPDFKEICVNIYNILPEVYKDVYTKNDKQIRLLSIWINVSKGDDSNISHVHPHNHISGCLYVKCNGNSGAISFTNPSKDLMQHYGFDALTTNNNVFQWQLDYTPSVGDLIVFPSWVYHSVLPSNDNEERISIAFNTVVY